MIVTLQIEERSVAHNKPTRIYILGAGFSKSFNPSLIPLMADFLQIAKSSNKYQLDNKHSQLAQFIARYFGIAEYHDIEKVMSFLSMPALDDMGVQFENREVLYDQLIRIIQDTLAWAHLSPSSEITRRIYDEFASHLVDNQISVISFNYDLLLDNLLYKTGKWIGFDGYGADIPSAFQALPLPARQRQGDYIPPDDKRSCMYLLKLHGSINWGMPTLRSQADTTIYQDPHGCYHGGYFRGKRVCIGPLHDLSITPTNLPLPIHFKPFLVPPILDKTSLLGTQTLRIIWNIAREAIANADELVFIGYSLPVTDFTVEFLFRQAIKTSKIKNVTVVAPKPSEALLARYRDVFGEAVQTFDGDTLDWLTCSGVIDPSKLRMN